MVVALAAHPKTTRLGQIYFEKNKISSNKARNLFSSFHVSSRFNCFPHKTLMYTPTTSDMLHNILVLFQSQPLSLECLVLKKILQSDVDTKSLPPVLQSKVEKFLTTTDQILPFINERGRKIIKRDIIHLG